ncbi:MAG TPA: SRPBCC family protein [Vicinamibacterales bacterium]|nr:SRPBCC family protein [Vicinamibacterales bacterium]
MMSIAELSRIDRAIEIQAPPERVWRALTDSRELSAWFQVKIEGDIAPGSTVWMTSVNPQHNCQRFRVRFTELTPPRRLVWQWHPGEVDPAVDYSREPETTVTFTLEASGKGTRVTVSETGFDAISLERRAKVYADNSQGWTEVLGWLQRHVEAAR